jgi:hypothetical protein
MDEFAEIAREREATRIARRQWFWLHAAVYLPTQVILFVIWIAAGAQFPRFAFPLLGWGIILAVHGVYALVMKTPEEIIDRARGTYRPAMSVLRGIVIAIGVRPERVRTRREVSTSTGTA